MDFDTSPFDKGDLDWQQVWKNQWGVQSDNAYREIVKQLLTPFVQWPDDLRQYAIDHAQEELLYSSEVPDIQEWCEYKDRMGMIKLGRIVSRFFGHTTP